jgi:hypothetical protein
MLHPTQKDILVMSFFIDTSQKKSVYIATLTEWL